MLSTRVKLVSAPQEVNSLVDLRSYMPKAMAVILTREDGPVKGMVIPTSIAPYASKFNTAASVAQWALCFNHPNYNLHKVRYITQTLHG